MEEIEQNIFDNKIFFEGYKVIRENSFSANEIEEKPAIFSMLPDLRNKRILDLGCGYGENCRKFIDMGAAYVMGIDISKKMLQVAEEKFPHKNIVYKEMNMDSISELDEQFDIVVSSLAIHYVRDFDKLVKSVNELLNREGYFVFSQEHPIATAPLGGAKWYQGDEYYEGMLLTDYAKEGIRDTHWIVDHVIKYHRTVATIINTLIGNGFTIIGIDEPTVSEEIVNIEKGLSRCWHAPDFLLVKSRLTLG